MKKLAMVAGIAVLTLVLFAGSVLAGGKLFVVIDRGIETSFTDAQVKNRNQCGEWMEQDLIKLLNKAGYDAELIKSKSDYKGGSNLLVVKITEYNPGSKAARMMVGFGAGATSMKTHYELFGNGSSPIASDNLGVGSGRDWRNVIRKINEQTIAGIKGK